jgi:hypothetical protein
VLLSRSVKRKVKSAGEAIDLFYFNSNRSFQSS